MSAFYLKLIAVLTMIIDHIGSVFFPQYLIFRYIGRIAFPIYAFLVSEGCKKTKNFKNYLSRLLIFALISEYFFDLAFYNKTIFLGHNNTIFTLFFASLIIYIFKHTKITNIYKYLTALLITFLSEAMHTDYGIFGIILVLIFYFQKSRKSAIFFAALLIIINGFSISNFLNIGEVSLVYIIFKAMTLFSLFIIYFYNGEKGYQLSINGINLFYIVYPLHLAVIVLIDRGF